MATDREWTEWILAQRPPRSVVDPLRPQAWFLEQECSASKQIIDSLCILLTGKECPWRCLMCDLWQHTLTRATAPGAIPHQIDYVLRGGDGPSPTPPDQVKLYNSGSFFDAAAVPPADYRTIAEKVSFARNVVVESHPRLVGDKTLRFRDLLTGTLEVALGLETAQPAVLERLNKRFSLADFARAAEMLRREGVAMRAFVLVQPPLTRPEEAVPWAVKSAEFAFNCGASAVSLIPTRAGNGALDRLMATGEFIPPTVATLERALESVVRRVSNPSHEVLRLQGARAFADTWDLQRFSNCPECLDGRRRRLELMNLRQMVPPPVVCPHCSEGSVGRV